MKIYRYYEVTSTQEVAKKLIDEGKNNFAVVADYQKEGRGRLEREWISPLGGLYMSVVIKKDDRAFMRAGVAVVKALKHAGIEANLKWPNDVLVRNKKIAGILVENYEDNSIVGVGINISHAPLREATCIECEGGSISRDKLAKLIIKGLKKKKFYEDYRQMCSTIGKDVKIIALNGVIEGRAIDIDSIGRIVVETKNGIKKIASGDCIHLR
ncbi:MAG: biotin--[acetyl-CoA-carboxylase] ligase [Thermoplasmata archaeon]|nr:biotin--[acetyl-CoA-carboxylase] ligase [Thermoplasmata archaeon]